MIYKTYTYLCCCRKSWVGHYASQNYPQLHNYTTPQLQFTHNYKYTTTTHTITKTQLHHTHKLQLQNSTNYNLHHPQLHTKWSTIYLHHPLKICNYGYFCKFGSNTNKNQWKIFFLYMMLNNVSFLVQSTDFS